MRRSNRSGGSFSPAAARGGTDGSRLSFLGHPTPKLFSGGMLPHSRKEWIAERALAQAAETIVHLGVRWLEADQG